MGSSPPAPASPAPFILHIGAHKTASTHLQSVLLANRDWLRAQGCAYFGPDLLRGDLKLPRPRARPEIYAQDLAALRGAVDGARGDGARVLISEENIHGGGPAPPVMADGARYYPQAVARITRLVQGLDAGPVVVALALRDPGAHLVSGWGHQFLAGRPGAFSDYAAGVDLPALRWSELVLRLLDCPEIARVLVWRQEDYRAISVPLWAALTGLQMRLPDVPEQHARLVGPSARAIEELPVIAARNPDMPVKQAMRRAMKRFPKSTKWPAPEPIAPELRAEISAAYAADWARLTDRPGVTCLTP